MAVTLQESGRRIYVRGNTYPLRDALRAAGAHWDADARAWWVGKDRRAQVEAALARVEDGDKQSIATAPGADAVVAGKAEYHGKPCYLAGRTVRGRTRWDDAVVTVESRDGQRLLLYSLDGSRQWWADRDEVRVTKAYQRPQTIGGLRRFAEKIRRNGGVHPDACPYCGSLSCSAAYGRGGLCDED